MCNYKSNQLLGGKDFNLNTLTFTIRVRLSSFLLIKKETKSNYLDKNYHIFIVATREKNRVGP